MNWIIKIIYDDDDDESPIEFKFNKEMCNNLYRYISDDGYVNINEFKNDFICDSYADIIVGWKKVEMDYYDERNQSYFIDLLKDLLKNTNVPKKIKIFESIPYRLLNSFDFK